MATDKAKRLRELIDSPQSEYMMEAHNGLSAKIAEEAGFQCIWASSLTIASSLGLRDSNEASWTQVLDICEFMADATETPILMDGDTGYGNFNNVRRLIKKLEQRGIAGVCLEDKIFPKSNSFVDDPCNALADLNEMCGRIRAAKDTQHNNNFVVIARTEGFNLNADVSQVLDRAHAYRESGADAILVHSKKESPVDIENFMARWNNACPIVVVPTMYWQTPTKRFNELGVSLVIWANHNLRAAVKAMQALCANLQHSQQIAEIQNDIVSIDEIFRLQNLDELLRAERRYLPNTRKIS